MEVRRWQVEAEDMKAACGMTWPVVLSLRAGIGCFVVVKTLMRLATQITAGGALLCARSGATHARTLTMSSRS